MFAAKNSDMCQTLTHKFIRKLRKIVKEYLRGEFKRDFPPEKGI